MAGEVLLERPAIPGEIDALFGVLLRTCETHAAHLRAILDNDESYGALKTEEASWALWLPASGLEEDLSVEPLATFYARIEARVEALGVEVPSMPAEWRLALVVRAAVLALDDRFGHRLVVLFAERGDSILRQGQACPVPRQAYRTLFASSGTRLAARPESLGPALFRTEHAALVPPLDGRELVYSSAFEDALAPVSMPLRLAAAVPLNPSDLDWVETTQPPRFFDVAPRDLAAAEQIATGQLRAAVGVDVVVFPELSMTRSIARELVDATSALEAPPKILVTGSFHAGAKGARRNTVLIAVPGQPPRQHHKFNRFALRRGDLWLDEDIVTTPARVTIYAAGQGGGNGWSLATLICKDLLEPGIEPLLSRLRVSLVLVPSCSPLTAPFEGIAQKLATTAQAAVLIVNMAEPDSDAAVAIFASPRRDGAQRVIRRRGALVPDVHIFDLP